MAPENGWLEYYFPIGMAHFQGLLLLVSGRVVFFKVGLFHYSLRDVYPTYLYLNLRIDNHKIAATFGRFLLVNFGTNFYTQKEDL